MTKFARIKFTQQPDDVTFDRVKGVSVTRICVECYAWNEIASVKAMANPDHRAFGFGKSIKEAEKDAVKAVNHAHYLWMTER